MKKEQIKIIQDQTSEIAFILPMVVAISIFYFALHKPNETKKKTLHKLQKKAEHRKPKSSKRN